MQQIKQEEEKLLLIADMGESIQVKQVPKTATVLLEVNICEQSINSESGKC